jgi:HD-GYP domain-containing protein (c-di-GMP phosphodiesterase class II)
MPLPRIVLSATGGQTWSFPGHLRIGRLADLEVALDDPSVSRLHAEIYLADDGWVIRDRGSSNGTYVNNVRIGRTPVKLHQGDTIRIGSLPLKVESLQERPEAIRVGNRAVQIEAATGWLWESDAVPAVGRESGAPSAGLAGLMRATLRLAHAADPEQALAKSLAEAVQFFRARRGGVFVAEDDGQLTLKCSVTAPGVHARPPARTLAAAALRRRQSLLFKDASEAAELHSESAVRGELGSAVCALLRTPDRDTGVFYLDRGRGQEAYAEADMYLADSVAAALALSLDRQHLVTRHQSLFLQAVTALAQAVEMRDRYTGNHTHRVTAYALLLAEEMGLPADEKRQLQVATALHDIGKIAIDDQILRKPDRLLPAEFEQMKTHVLRGAEIVQMIPGLTWALPVVRGHHERWDGTGYPDQLAGPTIPLTARIVAVVDAFDAMTSDRPYRPGMPVARAFAELQAGSGTHFDPDCVAAFVRVRPRIEEMLAREATERSRAATSTETVSRKELEAQIGTKATHQIPPPDPRVPDKPAD